MIREYIAYLRDNPKGYWFKRKLYGWGWTPATWQGWGILASYLVLILILSFTITERTLENGIEFTFIFPVIILTIIFLIICYRKGEKPRWQWGIKKKGEEKN